ncbi:hypothetical protein V6N13_096008 [Hibiscus sabdariffa]
MSDCVSESRSLPKGGFDLGEFPPLGDTPVVTPKAVVPAWKFLDQSLQFFPPVKKDGQVRVSPPLEAMNSSAQQLCNTLIGFFWVSGLWFYVVSLDSAPVWVNLWHVPLELFYREGLSYITSALGKPLYTDHATTLRMQLEFATICIEVSVTDVIMGSVTLDLGEGVTIVVGVELAWAPPKCDHCVIFGHSTDNCFKVKGGVDVGFTVRLESDAHVDSPDIGDCIGVHYSPKEGVLGIVSTGLVASLPLGEEAASAGGFVQGVGSDKVVYCDMVLERIESAGDFAVEEGHMVMSVSSPNRFEALGAGVEVVDKQGRVSTNDVVLLMNQLKPKARGRNHQHGKGGEDVLFLSVVYACNGRSDRLGMWSDLLRLRSTMGESPGCLGVVEELSGLIRAKEKLLHQKLRAQFLKEGDQNTIFVFRQIAIQQKASTVRELLDAQGNKVASYERISDLFVQFFSSSLGMVDPHVKWISNDLLKKILGVEFSSESRDSLVAPITRNKIKDVVFSMNGNKAPRLDGYSENFFQVAW